MKLIKKYFNKIRLGIVKYCYTNRLFLTYLILSISGAMFLRYITVGTALFFKATAVDLGLILIIGSFGYLVKPKNQFKYFFTWIIIFTLIEFVNSIYFVFYSYFASIGEIATLGQTETVADSIYAQLRISNFVFLLQTVIFYYIHHLLKETPYYNLIAKIERKKTLMVGTAIVGACFLIYSFATATGTDYSRLNKQWDRTYVAQRFGIILYQANDILQTVKPKITSLFGYEDAVALYDEYFNSEERNKYLGDNKYTDILKGYNVVYIHMESMQNFLMDLEFNGEEVTPNLNKLSKEGLFFSNFYPQVSIGTSSDAEYMMLTGLLPSLNGTVFISYYDNTFRTMATFLKERGYHTFSMHGNAADMWGRRKIHPHLGYDELIFKDSFTFDPKTDTVGLGINDEMFFEQAVEKLETMEATYENYFGTLITLSNHSPFDPNERFTLDLNDYYTNELGEQTSTCYLCKRTVGKYIVSANYADKALGEFIDMIKNSDYFNNTVFVFYGDHDAKISYKDMNYLYNYDYLTGELKDELDPSYVPYDSYDHQLNKKTPLIIWTKNSRLKKIFTGEVKTITGMYNVAPTLYTMLGIDNKYTLGHDIFNIVDNNIVVFPSGNYLTEKVYYNNSTGEYKVLKDDPLDIDYINDNLEYAEKTLEVGNAIVSYDLFNER